MTQPSLCFDDYLRWNITRLALYISWGKRLTFTSIWKFYIFIASLPIFSSCYYFIPGSLHSKEIAVSETTLQVELAPFILLLLLKSSASLLYSLMVPNLTFESLPNAQCTDEYTTRLVLTLPLSQGYDTILMVVNIYPSTSTPSPLQLTQIPPGLPNFSLSMYGDSMACWRK